MRGAALCCVAVVLAAFLAVASIREETRRELEQLRSSHEADRRQLFEQLASERRQHSDELASARDHIFDINRRLAAVEASGSAVPESPTATTPDAAAMRSLQEDPGASDPSCLDPTDISVAAINSAWSLSNAFDSWQPGVEESLADLQQSKQAQADAMRLKANASAVATVEAEILAVEAEVQGIKDGHIVLQEAVDDLSTIAATLGGTSALPSPVEEALACTCELCADKLCTVQACQDGFCSGELCNDELRREGGELCVPWGNRTACDCILDPANSSDPFRQEFPVTQTAPDCCRPEWSASASVFQTTYVVNAALGQEVAVYSRPEIIVKVNGEVSISFVGYESVEQTDSTYTFMTNSDRLRCPRDNDGNGGSCTFAFGSPGDYFFKSSGSSTLRLKVRVVNCMFCTVIAGYSGSRVDALSHALESRVPGNYNLTVESFSQQGLMNYLTVYAGQTLAVTGNLDRSGQVTLLEAFIHILDYATLELNSVHITSAVTQELRGNLIDNTGRVVAEHPGLPMPLAQDQLPSCELGDRPAVIMYRKPELDMDVLMSCSVRDGVAAWRQVFTMGGGMYDGTDIDSFVSAIGSGLPGKYALRVSGPGTAFVIGELLIHPYQDVRVICEAMHDSALSIGRMRTSKQAKVVLYLEIGTVTFDQDVVLHAQSSLLIEGAVETLSFMGRLEVAQNSTTTIRSSEEDSIRVTQGATWYALNPSTNQGMVQFDSVGLLLGGADADTHFGSVTGSLPGSLNVSVNGLQPGGGGEQQGVVTRSVDGSFDVPDHLSSAMGQIFNEDDIAGFVAAVQSGVAGLLGLQLTSDSQAFELPELSVAAGQDVRVFVVAAGASVTFGGTVSISGAGAGLTVRGSIDMLSFSAPATVSVSGTLSIEGAIGTLEFSGGLDVAEESTVSLLSASDRSINVVLGTVWFAADPTTNQGTVSFHTVGLLNADLQAFGVVDGELPGDLAVVLDANQPGGTGAQTGTIRLVDNVPDVPDNLNAAIGRVLTDAQLDEFVTTVNSGSTGLIGLQLRLDDFHFELGALDVVDGQDVRVFSTAKGSTLLLTEPATVASGGMLTIGGTLTSFGGREITVAQGGVLRVSGFVTLASSWLMLYCAPGQGRILFDGGVTMALPNGHTPTIGGELPGTVTAMLGGQLLGTAVRESGGTFSTTPDHWMGHIFVDQVEDFAATVEAGVTGFVGLHLTVNDQAVDLPSLDVLERQDVRVFSSATGCSLTRTGRLAIARGGSLTLSGTLDDLEFSTIEAGYVSVAAGGELRVSGSIRLSDTSVLGYGMQPAALRGRRTLAHGVTVTQTGGAVATLQGELPGTLTAESGGATAGSLTRTLAGQDSATSPDGWLSVVVTIKAWGGGGGGGYGCGGNGYGGGFPGGAGGFAQADYLGLAGDTLTVQVGNYGNPGNGNRAGGWPNGANGGSWGHHGGGGGGSSHVRGHIVSTRASTGVVVGAGGGGGGGGGGSSDAGGGGGGGTYNGNAGSGGAGGTSGNNAGTSSNGNGSGGQGNNCDNDYTPKAASGGGGIGGSRSRNIDGVFSCWGYDAPHGGAGGGRWREQWWWWRWRRVILQEHHRRHRSHRRFHHSAIRQHRRTALQLDRQWCRRQLPSKRSERSHRSGCWR
eukprot:COSAG02_NODE_722_length_18047_cov_5.952803_6_plen_1621_part_00